MISADERNYYRDIHSIKQSLESIAKSLRVICESTKPISFSYVDVVADPFEDEYGQKEPDSGEQEKLIDSRENTEL